ncbi:MAG: NAD(P)-dependent oxidoreductase [Subdoligranulum variabile]|nr:MAG: NAD(P)-dependent oxidoreductase [Subdoligranulum variabile]
MEKRQLHTAVVTGPTGAIGIALCQRLLQEGFTVYAVSRPGSPRAGELPQHERLHKVECDLQNYNLLPQKIRKADVFFHFAWAHTIGPGRNDMPAQIRNVEYTIDAVRAAKALGCKVFLGAGSQAEYGRVTGVLRPETPAFPENGYGMAKLCAGQMSRVECHTLELEHVWARILSVYGPYDGPATMISTTVRTLLEGGVPKLTAGEQKWDYLFSEDAAEAFLCMAYNGKDGAVYPLGSGKACPLREYVSILRDAINPNLELGLGQISYISQQVMHLQADISTLQQDTGFAPVTDFAQGIRKTIEWIRSTAK